MVDSRYNKCIRYPLDAAARTAEGGLSMKFIDLLKCIDLEQEMKICMLAENGTDVQFKISGDQASVISMVREAYKQAGVDTIECRENKLVVWLRDLD